MRQLLLSNYWHPIFSIISFPYHSHLVCWQIIHTHMENQPVERHTISEMGTVAHFQKKEGLTFMYFLLFSLVVYVYLFHFTNIIYYCSFLSWTLPYCPIDVRMVLLHVTRVKTPLQCWSLDIFLGSHSYLRDFEVPLVLSSFRICCLSHTVDAIYNYLHKHWLYWGDLSFIP